MKVRRGHPPDSSAMDTENRGVYDGDSGNDKLS